MNVATMTGEKIFRNPTRQLTSLLAPLEKRCLLWLAARLPAWVHSDHLTGLALLAMAGAGASFALARYTPAGFVLVVVFLALNWFGDSLDGTLARVRKCERPRYGFYVDHVIDALGTLFLLGGMGLSGYMSPIVALGLFAAYLLVCAEVYLRTSVLGVFQMSFAGIGPTELRIILSIGCYAAFVHPTSVIFGRTYLLFDVAGTIAAIGLLGTFIVAAARTTRELYRAEPMRK